MTTKLLPVLHTAINTYNCYQFEDLKKSENKSTLKIIISSSRLRNKYGNQFS